MTAERVLVVEDDLLIGESLLRALESQRYDARHVTTLAEAGTVIAAWTPGLVLLDLTLPDGDGIEFCSLLAATRPALPVVILTARSNEADVVVGLRAGAVDYVTKPFRLAELFARVASHLRFAASSAGIAEANGRTPIRIGELMIEPEARRATFQGEIVDLRPKEFDLLLRLASTCDTVVTREQLIADVQALEGPGAMVLSLKAGGTGLNLTNANHVVLYDRWWNPAVEDQARDRAWRIGQSKTVISHRLVCPGTVDEKVEEVVAGKRHIAQLVLPKGSSMADLDTDQLRLAFGLRPDELLTEED